MTDVTIIICTHNPRKDYFERVVDAVQSQTLSVEKWNLIVADNGSCPAASDCLDREIGENGQWFDEPRPGKVYAMSSASRGVMGDWVVFVDDDNVLKEDYLEKLNEIAARFPGIGVLSASIDGEFEGPVPDWIKPYLNFLAVRPLDHEVWANFAGPKVGPIGAGMCVRREIYDEFVRRFELGSIDPSQGRTSGSLAAGTDDTVFMEIAFELGFGCGAFPQLKMTHLMPKGRLKLEYMERLIEDITRTHTVLGGRAGRLKVGWKSRIKVKARALEICFLKGREKRCLERAKLRGHCAGLQRLAREGNV